MIETNWPKEFPAAITVCDPDGIILQMNDQAKKTFSKSGGEKLIGTNLLDCHPEPARSKAKSMLGTQKENTYTIEKDGIRKLIHQSPWYQDGKYSGFVEISIELPENMPNFVRKE